MLACCQGFFLRRVFLELSANGELSVRSLRAGSASAVCLWSTLTCQPVVRIGRQAFSAFQGFVRQLSLHWNANSFKQKMDDFLGPIMHNTMQYVMQYLNIAMKLGLEAFLKAKEFLLEKWTVLVASLKDVNLFECVNNGQMDKLLQWLRGPDRTGGKESSSTDSDRNNRKKNERVGKDKRKAQQKEKEKEEESYNNYYDDLPRKKRRSKGDRRKAE